MRVAMLVAVIMVLAGCQLPAMLHAPVKSAATASAAPGRLELLANQLQGQYDNHEQARVAGAQMPIAHIRHDVRILDRSSNGAWLQWQVQILDVKSPRNATWLYRLESAADGHTWTLTPHRPADASALSQLGDGTTKFEYRAESWPALGACAQSGKWENDKFDAKTDMAACSALLPGMGEGATLLPLRTEREADMLRASIVVDQARGADAFELARRVRWFGGWAAINGGGALAKANNSDWHMRNDLRLSSEGGRVSLRWRDGGSSGYSLELERLTYTERHLDVLQLNLIEDASGKTITYIWVDPVTSAVGMNLGWLQIGLIQQTSAMAQ